METQNKITRFLRIGGGLAVVFSIIHFLVEGRYDLNTVQSHAFFLFLNTLLCGLGILCSQKFKEPISARVFIFLSLCMVPAQFAQIGGYLYSKLFGVQKFLPDMIRVTSVSDTALIALTIASIAISLPILYLGFSALLRSGAKLLSLTLLVNSTLIAVPTRDPLHILLIITLSVIGTLYVNKKISSLQTKETLSAFGVAFLPAMIILTRQGFYPNSEVALSLFIYMMSILLFKFSPKFFSSKVACLFQSVAALLTLAGGSLLGEALGTGQKTTLMFFVIAINAYSRFALDEKSGKVYRNISSVILPFSVIPLLFGTGVLLKISMILGVALNTTFAVHYREKVALFFSSSAIAFIFGYYFVELFSFPEVDLWQGLAATGICLILIATVVEKRFKKYSKVLSQFYSSLT